MTDEIEDSTEQPPADCCEFMRNPSLTGVFRNRADGGDRTEEKIKPREIIERIEKEKELESEIG